MGLQQTIAIVAAIALGAVIVFQLLLAAGAPLGSAAWGGRYRVLPPALRWGSLVACVPLGIAGWVILARASLVAPGDDSRFVRIATFLFVGLFALNTLGNAVSKSRAERYAMTPVTVLLCGCFLAVALG